MNTNGKESPPIAIVGVACRFPGDASSPEDLWTALSNGESAWKEFPQDRLNINGFYHPSPERSDSFNFRGAHFIDEDIAAFDAKFFGVAQTEADAIDPQQRLLLEVAYEAVENAGFPMETFCGSRTSVFVGSFVKDYEQVSMRDSQTTAPDCATGNGIAIMANRISYFFDLQGTSQTIDTGCSASLVCVHQAVNNLRNGQSDIGIAGGAGLILTPSTIMPMTSLGFLSEDGKCFTFDSRANGYGRGEGVGIVVLKRLEDAIRDNDTIRAVIRGTASNQDGRTPGITVPNPEAQVRCINAAYNDAGLGVGETTYVECHGTGTKVGDWRELRAISSALCADRSAERPMYVGSVKPNIGHLEGSAGVAGVIKAVLIAEKGQIPPHINFKEWNPDIKHDEWRVDIAKTLMKFPAEELRRISVNCFGFGGTNAHGVLDDARSFLRQRGLTAHHNTTDPPQVPDDEAADGSSMSSWDLASPPSESISSFMGPRLFLFSTQHREGIPQLTNSHIPYLSNHAASPDLLRDYSYTLYSRRSRLDYRAFVVAKSVSELTQKMARITKSEVVRSGLPKEFRPAFIFCGQGAQWAQMGMELMAFGVFRESIEAAARCMRAIDKRFDLEVQLRQAKETAEINLPEVAQPATTAVQVALVDLLRVCQINPVAVAGHSSGEIAAAYAAGIITRDEAWTLAFHRGQCAAAVKQRGRMLAVGVSRTVAQEYLGLVRPGSVAVACINSPSLVTLSGDEDSVLALKEELDRQGVFNSLVAVETAYHSHHMRAVERRYLDSIRGIKPRESTRAVAMYSSVHGRAVMGPELDAAYWVENMVSPVEFDKAVTAMVQPESGSVPNVLIEVSPHRVWGRALKQILDVTGFNKAPLPYFSMLERGEDAVETVLQLVGDLFLRGDRVDMEWLYRETGVPKCLVDLPPYPWDHSKTYWHESHLSRAHRFRQFGRRDYIGAPTSDSVVGYEPRWRGFFRVSENPWLLDHKVQKEILYPASGMVVMAIEAATQVVYDVIDQPSDIVDVEVSRFEIKAPMVVPTNEGGLEHCINAKRIGDTCQNGVTTWAYEFAIYSKAYEDAPFQENAKGQFAVRFYRRGAERRGEATLLFKPVDQRWRDEFQTGKRGQTPFEFYEGLDVVGMNYGPVFRNIVEIGQTNHVGGNKACWASIAIPNTRAKMPKQFEFDHVIHPATLDAIFQTFFTLGGDPMVPFYIESVRLAVNVPHTAGTRLFGVATGASVGLREASASIDMWADDERHVVQVTGLRAMSIASTPAGGVGFLPNHRNLCSTVVWKEDVRYVGFEDLEKWLDILGHTNPGCSILHLGEDVRVVSTVFRALARAKDGTPCNTPRFAGYTIGAETDAGYEEALGSIAERHKVLLAYDPLSRLLNGESPRRFNLVIIEDAGLLGGETLEKFVTPSGYILVVSGREADGGSERAKRLRLHDLESIGSTNVPELGALTLYQKKSAKSIASRTQEVVILTPGSDPAALYPIAQALQDSLSGAGFQVSIEPLGWPEEADAAKLGSTLVISLLELYSQHGLVFSMDERQYGLVKSLLQTAKGLFWVTRGAQMGGECPWNAAFLGWARTVRSEDSHRYIVSLDVDAKHGSDGEAAALIQQMFLDAFIAPLPTGDIALETEFAEVDGRIYIPRLAPLEDINTVVEHGHEKGLLFEKGLAKAARGSMKLEIASPGNFGGLYFGRDDDVTRPLGLDEIRISVRRTFLLPGDLDTVLGKSTRTTIGVDVAGTVVEVGDGVDGFYVGQEVVALVSGGSVRASVVVRERCVLAVPTPQSESGTVPWSMATVLTAYRAARGVTDTGAPLTVLVHHPTGAYGQAAIAVFRYFGARIIAVVSDKQQKEAIQKWFGLEADAIILEGAGVTEDILRLAGDGVDLVFDPSSGSEHMDTNFACVSTDGRVFQAVSGSPDSSGVRLPARSFEFVRFDLHAFLNKGTGLDKRFTEVYSSIAAGFPFSQEMCHTFSFAQAGEALKRLEREPHLGSYSLQLDGADEVQFGYNPVQHQVDLDIHGAYIVVGGFGGLGMSVAEWLAGHGAGHIVLTSHSGAPSGDVLTERFRELNQSAAQIHSYKLDVCNAAQVIAFAAWLESTGLKVRGVIHAAGVLRDFTYQNMQYPDWVSACQVKTQGSWNLHTYLPQTHVDFLLLLSSAAGVIGNRGQANYAAGNAFQDALARYRTARGQRTISLDLGPVIGAGMVDQDMMDLLRSVGYFGIRLSDVLFLIERAIAGFTTGDRPIPAQVVMGVGTGGLIAQNQPADPFWADTALYSHLNRVDVNMTDFQLGGGTTEKTSQENLQPRLKMAATIDEAVEILLGPLIRAMVAIIPNIDPGDIHPHMTPGECHSDSMRGTNIDNWLKRTTGVAVGQAINGMPLRTICEEVVKRGGFISSF